MRKYLFLTLLIAANCWAASYDLNRVDTQYRFSYEQIHMPDNIEDMGILGVHGILNFNQWFYGGVGVYGAVKGESGAYFALSLEGGIEHPIFGPIWGDLGIRVGAGGGRHTPVGGGMFYQPYTGISYNFGRFRVGATYSYLDFPDGRISSKQLGVELIIPDSFYYGPAEYGWNEKPRINQIRFPVSGKIIVSHNYFAVVGQGYIPKKGTKNVSGKIDDQHIGLLGVEVGHFFTPNTFLFGQMIGALYGHGNGYASALLGVGYDFPIVSSNRIGLIGRFAVGSAGGGNIDTGGGLVVLPTLGLEYHMTPRYAVEVNGGYLVAPEGQLKTAVLNFILKCYLNGITLSQSSEPSLPHHTLNPSFQAWRFHLVHQTYFNPRSKTGTIKPRMQLFGLAFDYFMNQAWYISGQTAFAYRGERVGGYFSGMIGLGVKSHPILHDRIDLFGEALVGTAGGAGLDIGAGALVEPVLGIDLHLNNYLGFQTSVGRIFALKGSFSSTVLTAGLTWQFSTPMSIPGGNC